MLNFIPQNAAGRHPILRTAFYREAQYEKNYKNKGKAMKILRSRLLDMEREKQEAAERDARRLQIKSGDRADKIRDCRRLALNGRRAQERRR